MPALRIGIELASLRLPLKESLATAARLGVDALEIDARRMARPEQFSRTALRQFRKALDDLNLRVAAVSYRTRRGFGTAEQLERRVDGTKTAMEFAYNLGAHVVVGSLGPLPPPDSENWSILVAVLDEIGRHGHRVGATLAAETGAESGDALVRLLTALPEGTLGIDFNPGNLVVAGHSPQEACMALGRWVLHVHVTDAIRGYSPGSGTPVPLGQGEVDFPALLGALEGLNYRGYWTISTDQSGDPLNQAAAAVQYLRRL